VTSFLNTPAWTWVLDPPRDVLQDSPLQKIRTSVASLSAALAIFSYALAETILVQSLRATRQPATSFATLFVEFIFLAVAFFATLSIMYRCLKWFKRPDAPFMPWFKASAVAVAPLHLLLPAVLLLKPFGVYGIAVYALLKAGVFIAIARRWSWAVQVISGSPRGAILIVLSPILVGGLVVWLALGVGLALLVFQVLV
jgi:hypothetical protein